MSFDPSEQIRYYHERVREYERVYEKPERQADLRAIKACLPGYFRGKHTLEIACGTGYWTMEIAKGAASVIATDINESMLELARRKPIPAGLVQFEQADIFDMSEPAQFFGAAFGGFIWSHIPVAKLPELLSTIQARLRPDASIWFLDNRFVKGSNTPIYRTDEDGNTYQMRRLQDGREFEVMKNFPTESSMQALADKNGYRLQWKEWTYFWLAEITPTRN